MMDGDSKEHFFLTKPTIIANSKFLAYTGSSFKDGSTDLDEDEKENGFGLHLYDLKNRCTIATIAKAEVLIDSFEDSEYIHLLYLRSSNNWREEMSNMEGEDKKNYQHKTEIVKVRLSL